jgi:hypothetical protein
VKRESIGRRTDSRHVDVEEKNRMWVPGSAGLSRDSIVRSIGTGRDEQID